MKTKADTSSKRLTLRDIIAYILLVVGVVLLLWEPVANALTQRKPTFAITEYFANLTETKVILLADLHEDDVVAYDVGLQAGWVDVWVVNARGEPMTAPTRSTKTELVIPEQGDYFLLIAGDHADVSVVLAIYTDE